MTSKAMSAAERKQRQREREADRARRLETLEAKRHRAQAQAEQLLTAARDVASKLAVERKLTISPQDIARYMLGLDGTEHVRQALAGKPVTLPPAQAPQTVTPAVTPADPENIECALCFNELTRFYRHKGGGKKIFLCEDCIEPLYRSLCDVYCRT